MRLLKKHGYNILRDGKEKKSYSKKFKEDTINRILIGNESITSVAIDIDFSSSGILDTWIKKYKENCYNVIERKKRRKSVTTKLKNNKKSTSEEKIKLLEERNEYLEAENEYLL